MYTENYIQLLKFFRCNLLRKLVTTLKEECYEEKGVEFIVVICYGGGAS